MAAVEDDALTPPKPFFLADSRSSSASGISDTASDADSQSDRTPPVPPRAPSRPRAYRNHLRRSSMAAPDSPDITPPMSQSQSDHGHGGHWSHNDSPTLPSRAPPSSFAFPFQAYPGNPDPGLAIPGLGRVSRRASYESLTQSPYSPFFPPQQFTPPVPPPGNSIYRNSVASASALPRVSSAQNFRAPFLAPSSRPSSSLWSPPTYQHALISPNQSSTALPLSKTKPPLPSTRLPTKLLKQDKPWLTKPEPRTRLAWWLTFGCMLLGLAASGVVCWRGVSGVRKIDPSKLCLVMDDSFSSGDIDDSNWSRDVELGGFGNGEFEMTTSSSNNAYISGGQLYIHPTLTTEDLPDLNIFDGSNYTLPDCTTTNKTACSVSSNILRSAVINPVLSARLNTKGKRSIKYGKVEVRAKLPRGDWLWPAIWMLPENDTYGAWPLSGEIDILEARGNAQPYPQGSDTVRSTLSYGPLPALTQRLFGWVQSKRTPFDEGFHTYSMEWEQGWMRFYVDTRLKSMVDLTIGKKGKGGFWEIGGFPQTAQNGSVQVVVENPYKDSLANAPFDQSFYLIVNLAAGGTSGWFPDNVGGKPWFDASGSAMRDFAKAQDTWSRTWPTSANDRAFRIDSVKMWQLC